MLVFINQDEDKYSWHEWFKELLDEEDIEYKFKDEVDSIPEAKEEADFLIYFASPESKNVRFASKLSEDIKDWPLKIIFHTLEEDEYDSETLESLKELESEVEAAGGKLVNAGQHAINYINYVEEEGLDYAERKNAEVVDQVVEEAQEELEETFSESSDNVGSVRERYENEKSTLMAELEGKEKELVEELEIQLKATRNFINEDELKQHLQTRVRPVLKDLVGVIKEKQNKKSETRQDLESILASLMTMVLLGLVLFAVGSVLTASVITVAILTVIRTITLIIKTPVRIFAYMYEHTRNLLHVILDYNDEDLNVNKDDIQQLEQDLKVKLKEEEPEMYMESPNYNSGDKLDKLSSSKVYNHLDSVLNLDRKTEEFLETADIVTEENAEIDFKKLEKDSHVLLPKVMDRVNADKIQLCYNENSSLSKSLMYLPMFKNQNDYKLYINVTSLAKQSEVVEDGIKSYEYEFHHPKQLENALISGYALIEAARRPTLISHNHKIREHLFELYSEMMMSTINRIGSIASKPENPKALKYILCKFMYLGMFDRDPNEKLEKTCMNMADAKEAKDIVDTVNLKYDMKDFKDIDSVLEVMEGTFPQLEIDLPSLVKVHTIIFGEGTLLCIDYVPYLVALAFSERFRFSVYTSSKNLRKNLKLPANRLQTDLISKLK